MNREKNQLVLTWGLKLKLQLKNHTLFAKKCKKSHIPGVRNNFLAVLSASGGKALWPDDYVTILFNLPLAQGPSARFPFQTENCRLSDKIDNLKLLYERLETKKTLRSPHYYYQYKKDRVISG